MTVNWRLAAICSLSIATAVAVGQRGLAIRLHVTHALLLDSGTAITLAALLRRLGRDQRRPLALFLGIPGIAMPLLSLAVGELAFLCEIRPAERFFERSLPAIYAIRSNSG